MATLPPFKALYIPFLSPSGGERISPSIRQRSFVHQEEVRGHYNSVSVYVKSTFRQGYALGDYDQRLTRVHRPGQTRAVISRHLELKSTVDRHVLKTREERTEGMRVGPEHAGKDNRPTNRGRRSVTSVRSEADRIVVCSVSPLAPS
jgi:hypothetical protein